MRISGAIILLAVLCAPCQADMEVITIGQPASVADTYSDITLYIGGDGTWSSPTYTLGAEDYVCGSCDNTLTASGSVTISSDVDRTPTNGIDIPSSNDYFTLDADAGGSADEIINRAEGQIAFWIYINTGGTGSGLFQYYAGDSFIRLRMQNSGTNVQIGYSTDGSTTNVTTPLGALTTGTWYWIVGKWKTATDNLGVYVYNTSGTLVDSATANPPATITDTSPTIEIGESFATACDYWMDTIIVTNSYTRDLNALRDTTESPR